jgi:hypothetical protein
MLESTIVFNGLTMNDHSKRSLMVSPFYWYRVTSVDGIWDSPVRFETHPIPQKNGSRSGDAFYSGKTITISGQIVAVSLGTLHVAQRGLQQAFYDMLDYDLTFTMNGEPNLFITCRKNQPIAMAETQETSDFRRSFVIQLIADDPLMYQVGGSTVYPVWTT